MYSNFASFSINDRMLPTYQHDTTKQQRMVHGIKIDHQT